MVVDQLSEYIIPIYMRLKVLLDGFECQITKECRRITVFSNLESDDPKSNALQCQPSEACLIITL
jgi:hypothetical protein